MIDLSEIKYELCQGVSRFHLERWLIKYFRLYFSDPDNIENENIKSLIYTNDENTKILIGDSSALDYELVEKRPAILIQRKEMSFEKIPILAGSYVTINEKPSETLDIVLNLVTILYIIICMGRTPGESELLAWETQGAINKMTRSLALTHALPALEVLKVSDTKIVPESDREYLTFLSLVAKFSLINKVYKT